MFWLRPRIEENVAAARPKGLPIKGHGPGGTGGTSGVRDGVDTTVYPNGQIREKGKRVAGKKQGKWVVYHKNGKLWSAGTYKQGIPDGPFMWKTPTGALRQLTTFKMGVQHGPAKRFYGGTGRLFDVAVWKDGKRVKVTSYNQDGSVKSKK